MYRLTTCMNCFTYSKENSNLKDLKREGLLTSERLVIRGNQNKHKHALCKASCDF